MSASISSRLIRDPAVYGGQHARAQIAQVAPPPTPFHRSPFSILGEDAANYTRALTGVPFSDSTQSGNALARSGACHYAPASSIRYHLLRRQPGLSSLGNLENIG